MKTIERPVEEEKEAKPIELSDEQKRVMEEVDKGNNVLITGQAGTGKSTLLEALKKKYRGRLAVTASTGIAAVNVGGMTIHSWAGIGIGEGTVKQLCLRIQGSPGIKDRIVNTHRLAIDEVSMIGSVLFTKLDLVFRKIRDCDKPFGGIQLVLFGDFLQLPPVSKNGEDGFCFKSSSWQEADIRVAVLSQIFRQQDKEFAEALQDIRLGNLSPNAKKILNSRYKAEFPDDSIKPVILHTHNVDVDYLNMKELDALEGKEQTFFAFDDGKKGGVEMLQKNCLAPSELKLKVGAQVMLLANIDTERGLANGSIGIVTGFCGGERQPIVEFANGEELFCEQHKWEIKDGNRVVAFRLQYPLRLSWAITVHKSQGATLDRAQLFLAKCFEYAQAYVALSRVRTVEGLFIESGDRSCIKAHPEALAFYENCQMI